ncbi:hypothetical protein [Actinomycetospora chiangmaiensis]|nr:hypothetical protein [Actinomycetospora chiangmaiensis]
MSTENERAAQQETDRAEEEGGPDRAARAHEKEDRQPPEATNRVEGD